MKDYNAMIRQLEGLKKATRLTHTVDFKLYEQNSIRNREEGVCYELDTMIENLFWSYKDNIAHLLSEKLAEEMASDFASEQRDLEAKLANLTRSLKGTP